MQWRGEGGERCAAFPFDELEKMIASKLVAGGLFRFHIAVLIFDVEALVSYFPTFRGLGEEVESRVGV